MEYLLKELHELHSIHKNIIFKQRYFILVIKIIFNLL